MNLPPAEAWLGAGHDVRLAVRDPSAPDVAELVSLGVKAVPPATTLPSQAAP